MAPIEHVFVVMLENRSFDHMLGFAGLNGIDAVTGGPTTVDGLTGTESNPLPAGERLEVSATADFALDIDPGHEFGDVLEHLCGRGAAYPAAGGHYPRITNSGFASRLQSLILRSGLDVSPAIAMRGFRRDQLPVLTTLAREFAVCDRWFSSLPGPTWPNRFFVHAATSGGLDSSPSPLRSTTAILEGYQFANGTIYDRLSAAGLKWSVVEGDALPQVLAIGGMVQHAVDGHFITFDELRERLGRPEFSDAYVFIEPHYGHVLADGRNFKCGSSQHPLDDVTRGERFLKEIYELIRGSPHWGTSALVVTYDEHGGFYDHVPPPPAIPPGDAFLPDCNRYGFRFDQLGVRVPALVASPYTQRGLIDHTVYDHTSLLSSLEGLFGLKPLTARDAGAERFNHLFQLGTPRADAPTLLPEPAISGLPDCEQGAEQSLAGDLEDIPGEMSGELEPALLGFVHVAVARELLMVAKATGDLAATIDDQRDRLLSAYHGIRTKFDAVRFLRKVETKYQAAAGR